MELLRKNEQLSMTHFKVSLYQVAILFINSPLWFGRYVYIYKHCLDDTVYMKYG